MTPSYIAKFFDVLPPNAVARLFCPLPDRLAAHGRAIISITTHPRGPTIQRRSNERLAVIKFLGMEPLGGMRMLRGSIESAEHGCACWLGFNVVADAERVAGELARRGLKFSDGKQEATL